MRHIILTGILACVAVSVCWTDADEITQLKEMYLRTELVRDGRASCVIAVPDDPEYGVLAESVAAAIKAAYGAAPPIKRASEMSDAEISATNVISLGIFSVNEVTEKLYLQWFVRYDYNWPGGENDYVIRTVHNPWLTGKNIVFVGSLSPAGWEAAVKRFTEILGESPGGAVGPIIEVSKDGAKPPAPSAKSVEGIEKQIDGYTDYYSFASRVPSYGNSYFMTGQPAYARLYLKAMRKLDELRPKDNVTDSHGCKYLLREFDRIEEGPAFSDEERLELTNILHRFASQTRYATETIPARTASGGNNWEAMLASYTGLYFARYYPDLAVGKKILANMDRYYEPDMVSWKPPEDCPGYGNSTVIRSYLWALHRPDMRYIENGLLREICDHNMLITNNLGRASGIGDTGSGLGSGDVSDKYLVDAYPLAAWLYKDGRYLWWLDRHGGGPGTTAHRQGVTTGYCWVPPEIVARKRPDELLGIARSPLEEWIYQRRGVSTYLKVPWEQAHTFPIDECYDKVSFRDGFEEDDEYLCMSGFGYGYHSHPDANAIVNYSDEGQTFLYDNGYMIFQPSEHNTVIVLKDGWAGPIPELARVTAQADLDDVGFLESRLDDYNGLRWDRTVIWAKRRYFLVVDDLECVEPGNYSFHCIWRVQGKADLDGRRWVSEKAPGRFNLIPCSDAALVQQASAGIGLNSPPFPLDKARRLVQTAGIEMRPTQSYQFANVFYTTPLSDEVQRVDAYRLADSTTYLIRDDGKPAMAGVNASQPIAPGIIIQGDAFHLSENVLTVAGARRIRAKGPLLSSDRAVNVRIDLASGEALVEVRERTKLIFAGADGEKTEQVEPGRHSVKLRALDKSDLQALAEDLNSKLAKLAVAPAARERPATGASQNIVKLWEYSGFLALSNFAEIGNPKVSASHVALTPEQVGHPAVGKPIDMLHEAGHVMFPRGETVRIDIDLGERRELVQIVVKSAQLLTFHEGCGVSKLTAWVSDDDFAKDQRVVGQLEITEPLQNAAVPYYLKLPPGTVGRYLRIEAVPYTDKHNVYIETVRLMGIGSKEEMALSGFHVNAMEIADTDGDGRDEIFAAGTDKAIHAIGADGSALWKYEVPEPINDLAVLDSVGDGQYQIVGACDDKTLYSVNEDGSENWTVMPPARTYSDAGIAGYEGRAATQNSLTVVFSSDIDNDGDMEIVVGSANWRTYTYDHTGKLVWDRVCWAHTPTCGAAYDLDSDGLKEVVMANTYGGGSIYAADTGKVIGRTAGSGHAGPTVLACADLDANGRGEIVVGDRRGIIWFEEWKGRAIGKERQGRLTYDTGSDVSALALGDLDGDGTIESAIASRNFILYLFDADGQPLWQLNLLDVCRDIDIADVIGDEKLEMICGCEDGTIKAVNWEGEVVGWYQTGGVVRQVRVCELDGDPNTREIVAACDDGAVYGLQVKR